MGLGLGLEDSLKPLSPRERDVASMRDVPLCETRLVRVRARARTRARARATVGGGVGSGEGKGYQHRPPMTTSPPRPRIRAAWLGLG